MDQLIPSFDEFLAVSLRAQFGVESLLVFVGLLVIGRFLWERFIKK